MEESIKNARKKAEKFLYNQVLWLNEGTKEQDGNILNPGDSDNLPILFEAHSYLAHKNEGLKSEYREGLPM